MKLIQFVFGLNSQDSYLMERFKQKQIVILYLSISGGMDVEKTRYQHKGHSAVSAT